MLAKGLVFITTTAQYSSFPFLVAHCIAVGKNHSLQNIIIDHESSTDWKHPGFHHMRVLAMNYGHAIIINNMHSVEPMPLNEEVKESRYSPPICLGTSPSVLISRGG